jgi:hypothetical protein
MRPSLLEQPLLGLLSQRHKLVQLRPHQLGEPPRPTLGVVDAVVHRDAPATGTPGAVGSWPASHPHREAVSTRRVARKASIVPSQKEIRGSSPRRPRPPGACARGPRRRGRAGSGGGGRRGRSRCCHTSARVLKSPSIRHRPLRGVLAGRHLLPRGPVGVGAPDADGQLDRHSPVLAPLRAPVGHRGAGKLAQIG